jgi:cellulose biosynthesis protein BcsQ
LCNTTLRARVAYDYAAARGNVVTLDDPNGLAAAEIRQLGRELGLVN